MRSEGFIVVNYHDNYTIYLSSMLAFEVFMCVHGSTSSGSMESFPFMILYILKYC